MADLASRAQEPEKFFTPQRTITLKVRTVSPHDVSDFTVLVDATDLREALKIALPADGASTVDKNAIALWVDSRKHFDYQCHVDIRPQAGTHTSITGTCRLHAALCLGGTTFSVTLRSLEPEPAKTQPPVVGFPEEHTCRLKDGCEVWSFNGLRRARKRKNEADPHRLLALGVLTDYVSEWILPRNDERRRLSGLVLYAGATKSGKTKLLEGTLGLVLKASVNQKGRTPHVVVVGDPVETLLYERSLEKVRAVLLETPNRPIDFTPRMIGVDVDSVRQATEDALRETPTVFVIDEMRRDEDLNAALGLAATGHLVLATAHSSSLKDAMAKMVSAFGADSPSTRASLAQRIKAIVHCSRFQGSFGDSECLEGEASEDRAWECILPAIWHQNSSAVHAFVSDGLSSLLFHSPDEPNSYCFGYSHALSTLEAEVAPRLPRDLRRTTVALELDVG